MKKIIDNNAHVTSNSKQVEILKKNFPNCFDKEGKFLPEKLNSIINDEVEISNESYELNWLGKKYARLLANQEVTTMLTEDVEHNSKSENINSQNLYLEGDNLEVLKHMVNCYSNQIKIIYIDPPYNTGTDFIYKDDRKFTVEELSNLANVDEDEAKRILEFTEANSNSHSAWLTFMYPRLYIARELLKDDGVIFISIDDNEQAQLKILCDEIYGEQNFIQCFEYVKTETPNSLSNKVRNNVEQVLCYEKNKDSVEYFSHYIEEEFSDAPLMNSSNKEQTIEFPPYSIYFPNNNGGEHIVQGKTIHLNENHNCHTISYTFKSKWSQSKINEEVMKGTKFNVKNIDNFSLRYMSSNLGKFMKPKTLLSSKEGYVGTNEEGTTELTKIFGSKLFDTPKSSKLLSYLINMKKDDEAIILDFFSGSSTTAHAVMNLNAEDGGKRKFIMVQLAEKINKKNNLNAYEFCVEELNVEPTIPAIAKERIKRSSELIKEENSDKEYIDNIDFGFKVYKTKPFIDTNYFNSLNTFDSNQTELLVTNTLSHEELNDLLLTWKLQDGIEFTKTFKELMLDDYIVHYVEDRAYFMYKDFSNRNIIQLLEELDDIDGDFAVRNLIIFATNFTSKEQRELVEAVKGYKNKKKIELNIELRY